MKFLLDQDVYMATARFLQKLGHDVIRVAQLGLARVADAVHRELERVLHSYTEEQLRQAFIVIEPGGYRFRKLSPK